MVMFSCKLCYSINLGGIVSTSTVHQSLLFCFTLYIAFGDIPSRHSLSIHEELTVCFVSGGAAVHGPNVLWSTPPIQKSTIETTWMESPSMLEIAYVWRIENVSSWVPLHCTFPKSIVQAYDKVQTSVETIPYIEGTRKGVICWSVKFQYFHGSWFLIVCVLHLSGTGWSWPAWDSSLVMSEVADPVSPSSTGSCCFGSKQGRPIGW